MSHAPQFAAGWHQDPSNPTQWRWWNGTAWTNDVSPMQSQQQAATVAPHLAGNGGAAVAQPHAQVVATTQAGLGDEWRQSHYIIAQRGLFMDRTYLVHLPAGPGGAAAKPADGQQVASITRKMISIKEKIKFRGAGDQELFGIQSAKAINLGERYIVSDASGAPIAQLKKEIMKSFLRSTWAVYDPSGQQVIARAREASMLLAVLRRLSDFARLFPYQFEIIDASDNRMGTFRRRWGFRDRYDLDLTEDPGFRLDRRVGVALGLSLDALQRR